MAMSAKDLIDEAKGQTRSVSPAEAQGKLILDVREPGELKSDGAIEDALNVPRGVLEMKADPGAESHEPTLAQAARSGQAVHVLCAAGGRATLAAATLGRMGYEAAVIEGGLAAWKKAGLPTIDG